MNLLEMMITKLNRTSGIDYRDESIRDDELAKGKSIRPQFESCER